MDCVSSCSSTNMRRLHNHLPFPLPCLPSPSLLPSSPGRSDISDDGHSYNAGASAIGNAAIVDTSTGRSTQMLLAMAAMGGPGGLYRRRAMASSYGSCATWSAGSLTEHQPATPSPVCSPVSSNAGGNGGNGHDRNGNAISTSFATPGQSSFISTDVKKPASLEEAAVQERLPTKGDYMKPSTRPHHFKLQTPKHPAQMQRRATPMHAAMPGRARPWRNHCESMENFGGVDEWELPTVSEEQDETVNPKNWQLKLLDTMSSGISSARDWNVDSDGVYYAGSNQRSSRCGNPGYENFAAAVPRRTEQRIHSSVAKTVGNVVGTKLITWKDAQIAKLVEKLKKKEANIDDWAEKQIAKAKRKMEGTEMKLEKKRARAADRMQRKIKDVQKKADKKKVKEQAAINNQIADVEKALKKMAVTGKLPWSLAFL